MINDVMICNVQYRGKLNNREGEFVQCPYKITG